MVMMSDGEALSARKRLRVLVAPKVSVVSSTLVPFTSTGYLRPEVRYPAWSYLMSPAAETARHWKTSGMSSTP